MCVWKKTECGCGSSGCVFVVSLCLCTCAIRYTSPCSICIHLTKDVSKSSGKWRRWGQQGECVCAGLIPTLEQSREHFFHSSSFLHPLDDKHLSPSLFSAIPSHLSSPSPPPPFPHPLLITLSFFFYGWVLIFPWDSRGGELSRMHCFIIPNKAGNKFRPPQLGLSDETLAQKPFFFSCSVFVCHVASFLYGASVSLLSFFTLIF